MRPPGNKMSRGFLMIPVAMQVRDSRSNRSIVEAIVLLLQVLDLNGIVLYCLKTIVIGWLSYRRHRQGTCHCCGVRCVTLTRLDSSRRPFLENESMEI